MASAQRIAVLQFPSQLSAEKIHGRAFADEAIRRHYQREYAAKERRRGFLPNCLGCRGNRGDDPRSLLDEVSHG